MMEYVYPKIKEYCREKHGLEYQVCRWSLVDEGFELCYGCCVV